MAKPSWWLGEPEWYLHSERKREPASEPADTLPPVRLRSSEDGGMPTMVGAFASFGEWTEIRSPFEGHFLERMAPSAFEKTITENRDKIRCLFHHGQDRSIGYMVLGPIRELRRDTSYEVDLFDVDYVHGLLPGLRAGQYGCSFRFSSVKDELRSHPERSDYNPKGLPEVTVSEASVVEFGPTPFPAYKGATAGVRSSREIVPELIHASAYVLGKNERWVTRSKPGARGVVERERVLEGGRASWDEQWARAYWWQHVSAAEAEAVPATRESWRLA